LQSIVLHRLASVPAPAPHGRGPAIFDSFGQFVEKYQGKEKYSRSERYPGKDKYVRMEM